MSACAICLDQLKAPVALPCGHVYCHGCISETVKTAASTSSSIVHCPTCREPVSTVAPNPLLIPPHLRPYVLSPFRRIYLNPPTPILTSPDADRTSNLTAEAEKAIARLHMENATLRQSCYASHAHAHAHMAAHFQLSALVRTTRDQARKLKDDRNKIARKYESLKRKFSDVSRNLEHETKTDQEEHVLIWNEMTPKAQDEDEANLQSPPEDVPCVRLITPVPVGAISPHELQRNAKRPRVSPAVLYPQPKVLTKPATSIPAMIIPHLVSQRTATSPSQSNS